MESPRELWAERPLPELIAYVLDTYHRPLKLDLARLAESARLHGGAAVSAVFEGLKAELDEHLEKEEQVLFPWLLSGRGRTAGAPVRVMLKEHESSKRLLAELRALCADYQGTAGQGAGLLSLYQDLLRFEQELQNHIRLEEEVVFPRGLGLL